MFNDLQFQACIYVQQPLIHQLGNLQAYLINIYKREKLKQVDYSI